MRHFLLVVGVGTGLLAAACRPRADSPLSEAAGRNDAGSVRTLIADTRPTPDELHWVLTWAARNGATDAMAVLLDAGADANRHDAGGNGWTPLQHAVHTQQPTAVRTLLDRGADPNLADRGGMTALFMAADSPDATMVQLLLDAGADPRAESHGGRTPLTQAVSGGALWDLTDRPLLGGCRPATVRAMLAHDPTLRVPETPAGSNALWWARFNRCDEVLKLVG
jgi:ankyrin repeat protein